MSTYKKERKKNDDDDDDDGEDEDEEKKKNVMNPFRREFNSFLCYIYSIYMYVSLINLQYKPPETHENQRKRSS